MDFEQLFERQRQKEEEKLMFGQAQDKKGEHFLDVYSCDNNQIGEGGFGFVKKSFHNARKNNQDSYVTKVIPKENLLSWQTHNDTLIEAEILLKLDHENIVKGFNVYQNEEYFLIVMEHCSGRLLFDVIEQETRFSEIDAHHIFTQICSAISYLHQQRIVHGDIKDENIILGDEMQAKIVDFGSAENDDGNKTSNYCGSETYSSPEVLSGRKFYRIPQEIWSLGVLLFVMVVGSNPFENVVKAEECLLSFPAIPILTQDCRDLISSIVIKDVSKRLTLKQIQNHAWVLKSHL